MSHPALTRGVLVSPDSFKGTFTAWQVADAIATGVEEAGAPATRMPIADGGEGTMAALLTALGGEERVVTVSDPLGHPTDARFGLLCGRRTAIVETAQASGLSLVAEHERDAWKASTHGTGELIVAAVKEGANHVILAVGGSATTDGGAGAITAISAAGVQPELTVLCDVVTPWEDAPRLFGPQKGADAEMVRRLERRLDRLADGAARDPRGVPLTGCAGGLSGGLWAAYGARLVPGATYVLDSLGFDAAAGAAGLVITGEGKIDEQTLEGKAVGEVAARCRRLGVPCIAVAGRVQLDRGAGRRLGLATIIEASTLDELRRAGVELAAEPIVAAKQ